MNPTRPLIDFCIESNRIEGIENAPQKEVEALALFLLLSRLEVEDVSNFVNVVQPGAVLRDQYGLNVRIGNYRPPEGAPEIRYSLETLLRQAPTMSSFDLHVAYESLHPFTDGNGRSGRAIWLWHLKNCKSDWGFANSLGRGFLHTFYYQTLAATPSRSLLPNSEKYKGERR